MSKRFRQQLAVYCVVALTGLTRILAHASLWRRAVWVAVFFFAVPAAWYALERYLEKTR